MPGSKAPEIVLRTEERTELARLGRAHTTGQALALRARIVRCAAEGLTTTEITRVLGLEGGIVRHWRSRWHGCHEVPLDEMAVAARLAAAPKPGAPARLTPEQLCQMVALACELPAPGRRRPLADAPAGVGRQHGAVEGRPLAGRELPPGLRDQEFDQPPEGGARRGGAGRGTSSGAATSRHRKRR